MPGPITRGAKDPLLTTLLVEEPHVVIPKGWRAAEEAEEDLDWDRLPVVGEHHSLHESEDDPLTTGRKKRHPEGMCCHFIV